MVRRRAPNCVCGVKCQSVCKVGWGGGQGGGVHCAGCTQGVQFAERALLRVVCVQSVEYLGCSVVCRECALHCNVRQLCSLQSAQFALHNVHTKCTIWGPTLLLRGTHTTVVVGMQPGDAVMRPPRLTRLGAKLW